MTLVDKIKAFLIGMDENGAARPLLTDTAGRLAVTVDGAPVFFDAYVTSTSYDGDPFSTQAKTLIDLSVAFPGVPGGIRAIIADVIINDQASLANNPLVVLGPTNVANDGVSVRCGGVANDAYVSNCVTVPCDANGDIYLQVSATGAGTLDLRIRIIGYYP